MEFVNEPNLLEMSGCPKGYTPELYAKNQDIFARWLRENYPDCLFVGTSTSEGPSNSDPAYESAGDSNSFLKNVPLEVLLKGMQEKLDVYSYHYYNGVAERLRAMMPNSYWLQAVPQQHGKVIGAGVEAGYLLSVALTMLFTLAVCFVMRRHVKKISMVESMKAPE